MIFDYSEPKTTPDENDVLETTTGDNLSASLITHYINALVNKFVKILPIKENEEHTLHTYLKSLQAELLGCKGLIKKVNDDPLLLTMIAILQFLIDNPECSKSEVKREVFRAISICNKLKTKYSTEDIK